MSTRQITECDRCHREITPSLRIEAIIKVTRTTPNSVSTGGGELDLCASCANKLHDFLGGRELDEPP